MYRGVGPEAGIQVEEKDAFVYACERCQHGTIEQQETFLEIAAHCEDMESFVEGIIDWFYSRKWTKSFGDETEVDEDGTYPGV